jgi:hypothetical protein
VVINNCLPLRSSLSVGLQPVGSGLASLSFFLSFFAAPRMSEPSSSAPEESQSCNTCLLTGGVVFTATGLHLLRSTRDLASNGKSLLFPKLLGTTLTLFGSLHLVYLAHPPLFAPLEARSPAFQRYVAKKSV